MHFYEYCCQQMVFRLVSTLQVLKEVFNCRQPEPRYSLTWKEYDFSYIKSLGPNKDLSLQGSAQKILSGGKRSCEIMQHLGGFELLWEMLDHHFSPSFFHTFLSNFGQVKVWLSGLEHVYNWACTLRSLHLPPPIKTCQLSICFGWIPSNSATELPSDSVAQLARAWQAIC